MSIVTIPRALMTSITVDWDIDWRGQSAGSFNSGGMQVVYNAFPRWIGSPTLRLSGDQIGEWRAIRAQAQGRANVYRVPMFDFVGSNPGGYRDDADYVEAADGSYSYEPTVTCPAGAAAGAESIVVDEAHHSISVGQILSYDDWPFMVTTRSGSGSSVTLGVQMPLRREIPAGSEIQLRATGLFRATGDMMGNPATGLIRFSEPQLSFEEWLNR